MKCIDYATTMLRLAADPEAVRQTLVHGNWQVGAPVADASEFARWLNISSEDDLISSTEKLLVLAIHFFRGRHPHANTRDIASISTLVVYFATGMYGDLGTDEYPKERYVERVVLEVCGGHWGDPVSFVPESIIRGEGNIERTDLILRLLESLYFTPRPEADVEKTIREVIDLLAATRHTFRSKQIERARELLEQLL